MLSASVVIPTHEHAATLGYAVANVQGQRIEDIEILIVGDGVDDAVRRQVRRLKAGDPRIRFLRPAKGAAARGEAPRLRAAAGSRAHRVLPER